MTPTPLRTLLALAASATLATAAQAETFYFTFSGVLTAGSAYSGIKQASDGVFPLGVGESYPSGSESLMADRDAGNPFAFRLGLDNGGTTALGQTWTAADVKSMTWVLPTINRFAAGDAPGPDFFYTLYLDAFRFTAAELLNRVSGQFSTDASGQVTSVFSQLGHQQTRRVGLPLTLSDDQFDTNGQAFGDFKWFGLLADAGTSYLTFAPLVGAGLGNQNATTIKQYSVAGGYGANAGLTDPSKWVQTTATGASLVSPVPEPSAVALVLAGLGVAGWAARRRRVAAAA